MKKKQPDIDPAEVEAFQEAVKDVRRIRSNRVSLEKVPANRKIPPGPPFTKGEEENTSNVTLNESNSLPSVGSEAVLRYHQPGMSHKTLRNLRKGQYNVDAVLDLHGMTVAEAHKAVTIFLRQCIQDGVRVVLIIHGKGRNQQQPILKNKLNHWLRDIRAVLAFCSASTHHGSRGAVYVYLRGENQLG